VAVRVQQNVVQFQIAATSTNSGRITVTTDKGTNAGEEESEDSAYILFPSCTICKMFVIVK